MKKRKELIPYSKQSINLFDCISILRAANNKFLTQGPIGERFERELEKYTNSKFCIATNSATSSLILTYKALGLNKNDYLWSTPITFVATTNAALLCDAKIDFVDIDRNDGLIDIYKLEKKIEIAKKMGTLPKILTVVHLYGNSPKLSKIQFMCQKNNIKIVEDASHALGTISESTEVGSCLYSDACIFSFHPVKIITTGEGGCVTTNNAGLANKIRILRSHGITKNQKEFTNKQPEPWDYEQQDLGYNFRLSNLHSSLGISQLKRIKKFKAKRRRIIKIYTKELANLPLKVITERDFCESVYHLAVIIFTSSLSRKIIFHALRDEGYFCQVHYKPVHLQPYYQSLGFKKNDFPVSEDFSSRILSIPCFPDLKNRDIKKIINCIKRNLPN